jgi:hypothetical protein
MGKRKRDGKLKNKIKLKHAERIKIEYVGRIVTKHLRISSLIRKTKRQLNEVNLIEFDSGRGICVVLFYIFRPLY